MKVYLSHSEACGMIREKFGLDQRVEIVIESAEAEKSANKAKWADIIAQVDRHLAADQRDQAIKYIRTVASEQGLLLGLEKARDIIGDWPNARVKIQTHQGLLF